MRMFRFSVEVVSCVPTTRRTDDGSLWRNVFGNNPVGLFWGQPIYRLVEPMSYSTPNLSITVGAGFETDLGTIPGIFGWIVGGLEKLRLIKRMDKCAILHDYLWAVADSAKNQRAAYKNADDIFLDALLSEGQPAWYAYLAYGVVRAVAELKLFFRKL